MNEFVPGLSGINKAYVGKYQNHIHVCEIKLLGDTCNHRHRIIQVYCPHNIKYNDMNKKDICDKCVHNRTIYLSDSGNEILKVE